MVKRTKHIEHLFRYVDMGFLSNIISEMDVKY